MKLLPCPFCGNSNPQPTWEHEQYGHGSARQKVKILCPDCKSSSSSFDDYMGETRQQLKDKAIQAWNRRT